MTEMTNPTATLPPGFRFHPTDEELILHYLRRRAGAADSSPVPLIADVDIYKFNPWDLPSKAKFGEREWYFFTPRDRKYPNGVRPNRAAASGYWKATGTDKPIHATSSLSSSSSSSPSSSTSPTPSSTATHPHSCIGVKKALVFYKGKPPKGSKTNWIMHEYRLISQPQIPFPSFKPFPLRDSSMRLDDWVLCRIYKKNYHVTNERDHEQEEEGEEEEDKHSLRNSKHDYDLHKSSSLSELLNQLFDNPSEILGSLEQDIDHDHHHQVVFNVNTAPENSHKRLLEDGGDHHHQPSFKKINTSSSTATNSSCLLMNQPFLFNQQILLNSHLGLHY